MSSRRNSLSPPDRTGTADPGAHELVESDSEEHYSDAQSGTEESAPKPPTSPIPKMRVEKVDDEPSYGEVPGTQAYKMREADATPDEIAIIPDDTLPDGTPKDTLKSRTEETSHARSGSPGGHPIPRTVVEESADVAGSVEHPEVKEKHTADAPPDVVIQPDGTKVDVGDGNSDSPIPPALQLPSSPRIRRKTSSRSLRSAPRSPSLQAPAGFGVDGAGEGGDEEDFGDDFDDFEEGEDDGDFGDFNDGFSGPDAEESATATATSDLVQPPTAAPSPPSLSFPILDFDTLDQDSLPSALEPYLNALFPTPDDADFNPLPSLKENSNPIFLTPRSASLWSQLVAPPPLQPPDWIRSRIRRLFLVSLGVPVDLDEILPATKQKKLVLPSLNLGSPRTSTDSRDPSLGRLKREGESNASNTSLDSSGKPKPKKEARKEESGGSSRRKGGPAEPEFDMPAAKQLCTTTDEALDGMTDKELQDHVKRLQELEETAKEVLDYWTKRTDEKIGDREAFEGVIENLVKHARKVRK